MPHLQCFPKRSREAVEDSRMGIIERRRFLRKHQIQYGLWTKQNKAFAKRMSWSVFAKSYSANRNKILLLVNSKFLIQSSSASLLTSLYCGGKNTICCPSKEPDFCFAAAGSFSTKENLAKEEVILSPKNDDPWGDSFVTSAWEKPNPKLKPLRKFVLMKSFGGKILAGALWGIIHRWRRSIQTILTHPRPRSWT